MNTTGGWFQPKNVLVNLEHQPSSGWEIKHENETIKSLANCLKPTHTIYILYILYIMELYIIIYIYLKTPKAKKKTSASDPPGEK